ncbi:hypothetical protein INH39_15055 [Massilia violaceinigra]|uniref:DUF4178 domain-containing protein n=1 Tax=Massilia violaceinigra TaxID=2045208 RepID=A0ABY4AG05_9BURK|nr:hypothetical protein [Massilia violaceinigra]UOD32859.1 hypothetical protein INH39_15055 [Massilia violaceinigra]
MNKKELSEVFNKNQHAYSNLLEKTLANAVSEKWGMGILPPLSFLPCQIELGGGKPGRILKNVSTPAKHRFKYLFDKQGRVILARSYLQKISGDAWMYGDEIFTYNDDKALQFIFSGLADDCTEAFLDVVVYASQTDGKIQKSCGIEDNGEYSENDYHYVDGKLSSINYRSWSSCYEDGELKIVYDGDSFSIFDKSHGNVNQIFPACS